MSESRPALDATLTNIQIVFRNVDLFPEQKFCSADQADLVRGTRPRNGPILSEFCDFSLISSLLASVQQLLPTTTTSNKQRPMALSLPLSFPTLRIAQSSRGNFRWISRRRRCAWTAPWARRRRRAHTPPWAQRTGRARMYSSLDPKEEARA